MLDIMSPYATLHMLWVHVSSCMPSCHHMLFSSWFALHSPHGWNHVSTICYSPHGLHGILLMLDIMSPYASLHTAHRIVHFFNIMSPHVALHMVCMNCPHGLHAFSTSFKTSLLMFFSIWFWCIPPHVWNHVSICFPPYAIHRTVHILNIMSPHAALHMVFMELSTWFTCVLHIIQNISTYAFLHMVYMRPSTWLKSCLHMLPSIRCTSHCPHIEYHVSTCCSPHG